MLAVLADALRAVVSTETAVFALLAISLNLQYGYAGLLNFGQVGFMMMGGYGVACTVAIFGGPFWLGVLVALVASLGLSLLIGLPTLRLRADYFAIASLVIAETLRLVARSRWLEPLTGGVDGLTRFADGFFRLNPFSGSYAVGPWQFTADQLFVLVVTWTVVLLATGLVWRLINSPWGRVLRAIREDEDATRAVGKRVFSYKMQCLGLGGLLSTVAGVLLAVQQQHVDPEAYLPVVTFYAYTALILGGAGRTWAPVVGSVAFWIVLTATDSVLARTAGSVELLSPQQLATVRFMLVGLTLILLVRYRPDGVFARARFA